MVPSAAAAHTCRALGGARRALLRARHHGGRAARPRPALAGHRHAPGRQIGLGEQERSALFYAPAAQGRRLLGQLRAAWRRCSRPTTRPSSAHEARGPLQPGAARRATRGAASSPAARRWPRRAGCAAVAREGEVSRELIGARCERGADIARSLELPEATAAAIRALDEHWDGSGHPARPGGEAIPLLGADPAASPRPWRSSCARPARPGRYAMARAAARRRVRPRAGRRGAGLPRRRRLLAPARGSAITCRRSAPGSPRTASWWPTTSGWTAWPRPSRG